MRFEGGGSTTSRTNAILEIDGPYFTVRLYETLLRLDVQGNTKNEIVEALENKPVLRQTIGNILEIFAPLHIHVSDIDSVQIDSEGRVKLVLPRHRDVTLPLTSSEAKKLVDKLNPLISREKEKKSERIMEKRKIQEYEKSEREAERGALTSGPLPIAQPPRILDELEETGKRTEEEQERED
jgi:hypothetical protein